MEKVKSKNYRTSAIFSCMDCEEEWQGLRDARKKAYEHAKKTGHRVNGEIVTAYHYN
jgi:ribosomal protein L34E